MTSRNDIAGAVHGQIVQAASIDRVTLVSLGDREYRPMQLPPPPHAFVDRVDVLHEMDRALAKRERGPVLFVLTGMAGVGKSAAATQWAHLNGSRFPGGLLYADLADYRGRRGVGVSDVVSVFLRALGVHEPYIPATRAERIALFRSRTAEHPVLVLLDGVDEPAQARSVVPGAAGSVVIVTSRHRLAGLSIDGAEFVDLAPLNPADSVNLMTGMVSASRIDGDRDAFHQLAELCAGLPLALRVAGAGLAQHRRWPVARLVRHLADDAERLERLALQGEGGSVGQMFDLAYQDLPGDVRHVYRVLGACPGSTFSSAVVAVAAQLDPEVADARLETLCASNLLGEMGEDRFRFHELIALHARRRAETELEPEERESVVRRVVAWYARGAAAADVAVMGGRWRLVEPDVAGWQLSFDAAGAMRWLDEERPNLLAAVHAASAARWYEVVWRMCDSLWVFYHSRKHYSDWIEVHRLGLAAAESSHHEVVEAHMRNRLARAHIEMHDFALAAEQLDRAAALAPADERVKAVLMESRGLLYREQRRYPEAVDVFRQLVDEQREAGDDRAFVLQSYQLGDVLVRAHHADEAVPVLTAALRTVVRLQNEDLTEARVRIVLGAAYRLLRKFRDAREELQSAVKVTHDRKQPVKEAQALEELVGVAQAERDRNLFKWAAERLYRLYAAAGNPRCAEVLNWLESGRRAETEG
jgi:tetratricopeptide (TPR) repeat protein